MATKKQAPKGAAAPKAAKAPTTKATKATPAKAAAKSPAKAPAKAAAKAPAKAAAKAPAKAAAKSPAKAAAKVAAKAPAKAAAKAPAKAAAKAPAKAAPAKAAAKAPAKAAPAKAAATTSAPKAKDAPAPKTKTRTNGEAVDTVTGTTGAKTATKAGSTKGATAKGKRPPTTVEAPAGAGLDAAFLEQQRVALLEERERYLRSAVRLQAEAEALVEGREPGDVQFDEESGEGDTIAVERERDLALSAQARQAVIEIDAALARIDDGTYGICQVSGLPIPPERLEAIPWARERVEYKAGGIGRR